MSRFVCVHGHFYQPPRENPWLDVVERQPSAAPYHDWNERVAAECYAPNTAARILGAGDRIVDIVNNFASMSFDAGPTLLAWLERARPDVYGAILEADREGRARFRGHGPALAQAYNHVIMPLASGRDKRTQVVWGMRDFERRFGRSPEGMWLPETAVDVESLEVMAEEGVRFTVLAQRQAAATRPLGGSGEWRDVGAVGGCGAAEAIDPRRPYLCRLPSGRSIVLFFYDGAISHDVAFGGLLRDGEAFAGRLIAGFSGGGGAGGRAELVHVATDGETYGHHHRFGEMALAYALDRVGKGGAAEVTVYGEFLERFPPRDEVRIVDGTSWSCVHGLERWRADCGCSTGEKAGWDQKWRAPLREAMDGLAAGAAEAFEDGLRAYAPDPWAVRNDYITLLLDRSPENAAAFLGRHFGSRLGSADKTRALELLEMARHAMLAQTSCGWFFDDISNLETVQVLQYAARAMQLAREAGGPDLEPRFVETLAAARSNEAKLGTGAAVYEKLARPAMIDLLRCGARTAARAECAGDAARDGVAAGEHLSRAVAALAAAWADKPEDAAALRKIEAVLNAAAGLGMATDLWRAQNAFFSAAKARFGGARPAGQARPLPPDAEWVRAFKAVGDLLRIDTEVFLP